MRGEKFALAFAMLFPTVMAGIYLAVLGGGAPGESGNRAVQIVYSLSKFVQFSLPVLLAYRFDGASLRWPSFRAKGLGIGVLFGVGVGLLAWLVADALADSVLANVPEQVRVKVAVFGVASPAKFLGLALFIAMLHSLLEEYFWRWFVHARLRRWMSFAPATILSSLAFMGHHVFVLRAYLPDQFWTAAVPFSLLIAVGGAFWAWLYERSGSLLAPWVSHLIVDAAILWIGYRMVFTS